MKYKPVIKKAKSYILRDIANAIPYGSVNSDKRVQIKMPAIVLEELDKAYPDIDRSKIITQLIVDNLLTLGRYKDAPDLLELMSSEQEILDDMWVNLMEKDNEK